MTVIVFKLNLIITMYLYRMKVFGDRKRFRAQQERPPVSPSSTPLQHLGYVDLCCNEGKTTFPLDTTVFVIYSFRTSLV